MSLLALNYCLCIWRCPVLTYLLVWRLNHFSSDHMTLWNHSSSKVNQKVQAAYLDSVLAELKTLHQVWPVCSPLKIHPQNFLNSPVAYAKNFCYLPYVAIFLDFVANIYRGRQLKRKWVHYYVSLRCYNTVGMNFYNKYIFLLFLNRFKKWITKL